MVRAEMAWYLTKEEGGGVREGTTEIGRNRNRSFCSYYGVCGGLQARVVRDESSTRQMYKGRKP
jgi:hypothetical protein